MNLEPADYTIAATHLDRFPEHAVTLVDAITAIVGGKFWIPIWYFDQHFATMRVKLWR